MKRENSSNSAANSTSTARPADSQPAQDALPGGDADRGEIYVDQEALAAELAQLSDVPTGETGAEAPDSADTDSEPESDKSTEALEAAADAALEAQDAAEAEAAEAEAGETTGAESDAAPDQASPDDKEPDAEAKPKHEGIQSRIDELTARSKTAEDALAKAQERLAAYEARDAGRFEPEVLEHVDDAAGLDAAQKRFTALHVWAMKNPEGGKLGDRDYSADEARELQAQTFALLNEALPRRRSYLEARAQADAAAVTFYPWLKDTSKGAGALVHQGIQQIPQLRSLPNYRLLAADAFIGQVLRQRGIAVTDDLLTKLEAEAKKAAPAATTAKPAAGKTAAAKTATPPAKAPAAPGRAGVIPPRQPARVVQAQAAAKRLRQGTGSEDDLASYIAEKL